MCGVFWGGSCLEVIFWCFGCYFNVYFKVLFLCVFLVLFFDPKCDYFGYFGVKMTFFWVFILMMCILVYFLLLFLSARLVWFDPLNVICDENNTKIPCFCV